MKKVMMMFSYGLLSMGHYQELYSISSTMNHRLVTSAPLQYKQIDYAHKAFSLEIEPWASGMFDPQHTMANLAVNGKSSAALNQLGLGDINPEWLFLGSDNEDANYASSVTFTPKNFMYGALFHCYKQFEKVFFDVKTALLHCKNIVKIKEYGGGNGGISQLNGDIVYNAYDAFTQSDWNYGKIGTLRELVGFENIQVEFGSSTMMSSFSSDNSQAYFAGFALFEVPTGAGTKSEWLFEPQIGTNHWGFGAGADVMVVADNGFSLVAGGNYRYLIANWEIRSFDLIDNGPWSRYLGLDTIAGLQLSGGTEGDVINLPGINLFTQDALIGGRHQITMYARAQKRFSGCLFELSYNYFYTQQETIHLIDTISSGFGIYDIGSDGGITTASQARINQNSPTQDLIPVTLVTTDLDFNSAAAGAWMSNSFAARLQRVQDFYTYGIGGSIDLAHSAQAISTWSLWINFEVLLP